MAANDNELIAAYAARYISFSDAVFYICADPFQNLITIIMSVYVIDRFEFIQINKQKRKDSVVSAIVVYLQTDL